MVEIVSKGGKYYFRQDDVLFKMKGVNHFTDHPGIDRLAKIDEYQEYCKTAYNSSEEWMNVNAGLLKSLGFNTIGAFSGYRPKDFFKTDIIYLSGNNYLNSGPESDFFSNEWKEFVQNRVREQLPGKSVVYVENEMKTGRDWRSLSKTLATDYLNMSPDSPGKKAIISFVRHILHGRLDLWSAVCLCKFRSWDHAMEYKGYKRVLFLEDKILEFVMRRFYRTCKNAIKSQDPDVLTGGSRLISWFTPAGVLRACAKYSDFVSVNYYWARFYLHNIIPAFYRYVIPYGGLKRYYRICKKPIYITEFGFIGKNGYNNNRNPFIYKTYRNQKCRADALSRYLKSIDRDWIIGLDIFEFVDQPSNGRNQQDKEDNNFGLINRKGILYAEFANRLKEFFSKFK